MIYHIYKQYHKMKNNTVIIKDKKIKIIKIILFNFNNI